MADMISGRQSPLWGARKQRVWLYMRWLHAALSTPRPTGNWCL